MSPSSPESRPATPPPDFNLERRTALITGASKGIGYGLAGRLAAAVIYLASPAAAMVTGTVLSIDGGWTAQ